MKSYQRTCNPICNQKGNKIFTNLQKNRHTQITNGAQEADEGYCLDEIFTKPQKSPIKTNQKKTIKKSNQRLIFS